MLRTEMCEGMGRRTVSDIVMAVVLKMSGMCAL